MLYYENENGKLYNGDCLEVMDKLIEEGVKVDAIITDPPYQTTACSWDLLIPFNNHLMLPKSSRSKKLIPVYRDEYILRELKNDRDYNEICKYFDNNSKEGMWQKLNKLIKSNSAIILFGSEPFSSALRISNIKNYKYDWVWEKERPSNFASAKHQPLRYLENIIVFEKNGKKVNYYPQMTVGKKNNSVGKGTRNKVNETNLPSSVTSYQNNPNSNMKYPKNIQKFTRGVSQIHPTQKPVALMEYLIKTYTNEGELVLDFTSGSGTTGVSAENTNRKWICIEKEKEYCDITVKRLGEAK